MIRSGLKCSDKPDRLMAGAVLAQVSKANLETYPNARNHFLDGYLVSCDKFAIPNFATDR